MKRLKLLLSEVMDAIRQNVEVFTCVLLLITISYIFFTRWNGYETELILDLFFLTTMAFHIGFSIANAIYRKRLKNLYLEQVERESKMLERFRATIIDMMKVNK